MQFAGRGPLPGFHLPVISQTSFGAPGFNTIRGSVMNPSPDRQSETACNFCCNQILNLMLK